MCQGNSHVFYYSGHNLPEGIPCYCGLTISSYEICGCCGSRILKPIPIQGERDLINNSEFKFY